MKNRKIIERQGKKAVIGRLDFHDWVGNLVSRTKAKVTEKKMGIYMISQILSRFNLTIKEFQEFATDELVNEAKEQRNIRKPVEWTRDELGNIVSPFKTK